MALFRHFWFQEASRRHTLEAIKQHEKFAATHEGALGGEAFHRSASEVGRAQHLQDIKDVNSLIAVALQEDVSGPTDVCAFSALYNRLDKDGSGKLSVSEVYQLLKEMGVDCSPATATRVFARFDKDRNGIIDLNEFVHTIAIDGVFSWG